MEESTGTGNNGGADVAAASASSAEDGSSFSINDTFDGFDAGGSAASAADDGASQGGDNNGAASSDGNEGETNPALDERYTKYQPYLPFLDKLAEAYPDPTQLEAAIQQNEAAIQEQAKGALVTHYQNQLGEWVNTGHLSEEAAGTLAPIFGGLQSELESVKARLAQYEQGNKANAAEQQFTALKTQFPDLDEQTVRDAMKYGGDASATAKRTHERYQNAMLQARSQQAAAAGQRDAKAPTLDVGPGAARASRELTMADLQGMTAEQISRLPEHELNAAMARR